MTVLFSALLRFCLCLQDFRAFSPVHRVDLQLASVKEAGRLKLTLQLPQNHFTYVLLVVVVSVVRYVKLEPR